MKGGGSRVRHSGKTAYSRRRADYYRQQPRRSNTGSLMKPWLTEDEDDDQTRAEDRD